jgi:hypothetical protein
MRKIEGAGGITLVVREDTVNLLIELMERMRDA